MRHDIHDLLPKVIRKQLEVKDFMPEKRKICFTKMQGAGNDYIYIDALDSPTSVTLGEVDLPDLAKRISDRHFGVGGDGLIVMMPSANADFRMRMFNADGSEAQMCGNASRCIGKYLHDKGFTDKKDISLETKCGIKILHLDVVDGETRSVTVDMGPYYLKRGDIPAAGDAEEFMIDEPVHAGDTTFLVTGVGMGNPHGVIFVDRITDRHVHYYGKILENSDVWPERSNIEFVKVLDRSSVEMRVWERGSGETLACGTGSCASAVASYLKGFTEKDVSVRLLGGTLDIHIDETTGHVFMHGPAEFVADGVYYYNLI